MNKEYVSEFTNFINHYLEEHPEEVKEQHRGWRIYWDHKIDLAAQERAMKDSVPDDGYGFYASAWHVEPLPKTEGPAR
ncbi:MAG: hypothetical protein ACD_10C00364G0003 [uncultured bacterium]|nr:MAG: hypothetical protein ACD_10C00364G0003 [uncultured bacterium]